MYGKQEYWQKLLIEKQNIVKAIQSGIDITSFTYGTSNEKGSIPGDEANHEYVEALTKFNQLLSWGFNDFLDLPWVDESKVWADQRDLVEDPVTKKLVHKTSKPLHNAKFVCMIDGMPSGETDANACAMAGGVWTMIGGPKPVKPAPVVEEAPLPPKPTRRS